MVALFAEKEKTKRFSMVAWIKKHKALFIIICVIIFIALVGIPFVINLVFKVDTNINVFQAEWSAGDVLGYYGAVLSFLGTVILGTLALYQNHMIKEEADRKAALLEEKEHIENMPKFNMRFKSCYGFGVRLGFAIKNYSKNISYDLKVYNISIKADDTTMWESKQIFKRAALDSNSEFEINLDSPEIKNVDTLTLLAYMSCKDKYNGPHEYVLKMYCSKPNNYICDEVKEIP